MTHQLGSNHSVLNAAQNSVAERRLRPIYEWLNSGNNKGALQECDRVLRKQSNFQCCKVLKSLALHRMGREDEAQTLLDSILSEGPTDEETLQAMAIAYRESFQLDKICHMYEVAIEKEPNNEDLLSHLFMSYVRLGDYKKQQQAAFALYKASPKNPYYFWAIMSILLYATLGKDTSATQFSFPLAQRMMTKMEKENKMKQEQETHLYLMVLEAQEKYKEALDILEGPLGIKLNEETSYLNFVAFKKIFLLKQIGRWKDVCRLSKESLVDNPDQWNLYLDYITSIYKLIDGVYEEEESEEENSQSNGVDASISIANDFCVEQQTKNPVCRGPYLAQIELINQQISRGQEAHSPLKNLLKNYFILFGHKGMCFSDINKYFSSLAETDLKLVLKDCSDNFINLDEKGAPKKVDDICRQLFIIQIRRYTGEFDKCSIEEGLKTVQDLLSSFSSVNHLVSVYENTELKPSDMYVVISCHLLWDMWVENRNDRFFRMAVRILESTLHRSPSNFHLRLLLVKFYNQAGAVGCSLEAHEGLCLKHIQLDSMGYIVSKHAYTCGHFEVASSIYGNTLKFFTRNHKDTVDHIISAYRCGSFDKIREFIKLRDRLANSINCATLTVEWMLIDIFTNATNHSQAVRIISRWEVDPMKDDILWDDLHDNRDFKAMVSFDSQEKCIGDSMILENFKHEKSYLKYRSLVMRSLAAALFLSEDIHPGKRSAFSLNNPISITKLSNSEDKENNGLSLSERLLLTMESILKELKSHLERSEASSIPTHIVLQGPNRPRVSFYFPYVKYYVCVLELVIAVYKQNEDNKIPFTNSIAKEYAILVNRIKDLTTSTEHLYDLESVFEEIVFCIESISITAILGGICITFLKSSISKKSKKKKGVNPEQEIFFAVPSKKCYRVLSQVERS
ncbi:N-alpha-acetyltransferase 25, NatB auxiliary subunit [Lepeophtheirus salmonis]|uniref:N-alpha-acetyltransferase 25, NatB auxiliary subunit n=1 Tax=Lepeophtheirus salmonis TaxID=72036 RepID=UPI001AE4379F|nr:N-alpha-acetyltransferase 25, NatB auxiliary subunit-like [Lepeophtheirus salmonis]